uniref:Histone deacetylase domain-containing protein n=2 Tax=Nothobranchius furzeri TaxID=105023 RepID=A0A1A7ZLR0_NOTFU
MASKDLLSCVHTEDYPNKFISGRINEEQRRTTGCPWSKGIVRCCRYETGGTVLAAQVAQQRGLACSTAGGTHHAFPSYGSGCCLLSHLAAAAKYLMSNSSSKRRILIVDLDVHLFYDGACPPPVRCRQMLPAFPAVTKDLYVMKAAVSRGIPVATVIGGGYSRDMDKLALRHSIVHRAATQLYENRRRKEVRGQYRRYYDCRCVSAIKNVFLIK